MSKKKRSYSVYLGGELFSIKQLVGNAWLAEAIYEKSHGRFRCLLPQDFSEVRGRSARAIRDHNLRALAASDLALFDFEGADLDSGTVVEFLFAKAADIPAVLMRSDIRHGREQHRQPWNIMASHFPRTLSVLEPSLPAYHASLAGRRRGIDPALHLAGQHSSAAGQLVCDKIAAQCVRAFERLLATEPTLPRHLREEMYQWLPLMAGIGGKEKALRKEFEHYLERKVERDLL